MGSPSKRVLITGLAGFTGQHLATHLGKLGFTVVGLEADVRDRAAVFSEVEALRPDLMVHLAAISFAAETDAQKIYSVNIVGTLNLLDALVEYCPRGMRVLLASSATVYGNQDQAVLTENLVPAPTSHYGCSKLAVEHLSQAYRDKLDILLTRPFNYTGVGHAEHFLIPKIIQAYRAGLSEIQLGNLNVEREFNDVRDICRLYAELLTAPAAIGSNVVNLCSGRPVELLEIIELMNEIAGRRMEVKVNPLFVRDNEIRSLSGSTARLQNFVSLDFRYAIRDTLSWMYKA